MSVVTRVRGIAIVAGLAAGGCGGGGGGPGGDAGGDDVRDDARIVDGTPGVIDAIPGSPDAAVGFETLITANWSLPPSDEGYWCATKTLTEDIYAGTLRPIAPVGTHHTVIAIGPPSGPDNPGYACGPEFGQFWASGAGTPPLELPDGVGLLAQAGQQLRLSLHLFNASDNTISGTSGLEIIRLDPSQVQHTATVSYNGPYTFTIPSNGLPYSATDTTSIGTRHIVAIFPHMHQLGTHFRARILGANATTLWDDDYQFNSQEFSPLPEILIDGADQLETQCTWVNNTGGPVSWGDSSTAEMCFTILMTY